jgi:MFS family permease
MLDLLRRNRDIRALFLAQVVSYMGDWFAFVALVGLLLDLTGSDLVASSVFVAQTLPGFLMSPIAGPAADHFNRRSLMVAVSAAQSAAALCLLLVGRGHVWVAFASMAGVSGLSAFFAPASQAAMPNLVEPEDLATATAMFSSTWGAMLAIGAAVGGLFTVVFGRKAAFVADAASFVVAALLVASIRRPMGGMGGGADRRRPEADHANDNAPPDRGGPPIQTGGMGGGADRRRPEADHADDNAPSDRGGPPIRTGEIKGAASDARPRMRPLREALAFARQHPRVLALLGSKMGFGLSGAVVSLLPVMATKIFHSGDSGTGLLIAARGVGVVLGPLLARRFMRDTPSILFACGVSALVYGSSYAVLPAAPILVLAFLPVMVAHLGGGIQWALSTYGLQVEVPDALRGRIFAADFALVTLTLSVTSFVAGALSTRLGPRPVILMLAGVSLAWGVIYLFLTRTLRGAGGGRSASRTGRAGSRRRAAG